MSTGWSIHGCGRDQRKHVAASERGNSVGPPNKALELTASAWGNVAVFHAPSAIPARAILVGGSSA